MVFNFPKASVVALTDERNLGCIGKAYLSAERTPRSDKIPTEAPYVPIRQIKITNASH